MLLSFNWSCLDALASESLRHLLTKKLKESFKVSDSPPPPPSSSSSGGGAHATNVKGTSPNSSNAAGGETGPSTASPSPSSGSGPLRFETIEVSDLRWGQVPPFMELVHMDDGFDFAPPTPRHHHGSGSSAAYHGYHDGRLRRDASDCCLSTCSSVTTHGGGGGHDTGSHDATPRTHSAATDGQQDNNNNNNNNGNNTALSAIAKSLRALLGSSGLYLKLHLTYGGNMSIRVQSTLRVDAPLTPPTGHHAHHHLPHQHRGSPSTQGASGERVSPAAVPRQGAMPPDLFPPSSSTANNNSAAAAAAVPPSPAHVLPVRLPLAFEVKHIGLDAYLHVNIHGSEVSLWLEPASSLSESPITKLGLVAVVGSDDDAVCDGVVGGGSAVGSPGLRTRRGPSMSQPKQQPLPHEATVFSDERLVAALVLEELKSILARHVVAPNCVTIPL